MKTDNPPNIFKTIVLITVGCGAVSAITALVPVLNTAAAATPFLEPLFNTSTYLFSTGVGAIFGMIGSRV